VLQGRCRRADRGAFVSEDLASLEGVGVDGDYAGAGWTGLLRSRLGTTDDAQTRHGLRSNQ
jgi:hypothetical protein